MVLAVVCGGLYFWGRHLLSENAGEYSRQVAEAEQEYVAQMIQWLQRPDDPRQSYDVEFFISAGVLEKIVEVLRGRSITLENGATLEIRALNLDLRDGFPLVRIEGAYHDGSSGLSFGGQAAAVLALEKKEDGFFFRVRPISFQPSLGVGAVRFALGGMLGSVSGMMVRDYAETWPGLRLPFERNIPVRVPSLEQEVIIKIGGKEGDPYVKTEFTFPKIETDLKVVYQGLLFTRSGIHLFADLEKQSGEADRPIVPSESWGQMSLQDKINALGFEGRDIGIRVSKRVFAFAVARVNDMPLENKLITLRGKSRFGDLAHGNVGPLYYQIWLANPPATHGTMQIATMKARVSTNGNEIIQYHATGTVQVEGQVGFHAQLGKPEKPFAEPAQDKDPIGVVFAPTAAKLDGSFVLNKDDPTLPIIAIMMNEQKDVELKARLRIPGFGHVTIHPKFTLPHSRMTRIKLPLELKNHGEVRLGKDRAGYGLEFSQVNCVAAAEWLTITADADLSLGDDK
ncbi:hypothetical protein QPK87_35425 [Kamptonema cortianum]|nr:hypothetical protein [Kamptonema cortianum]